eukprot:scaffold98969_cov75-Phaeocystis_antarctica.AAC.4
MCSNGRRLLTCPQQALRLAGRSEARILGHGGARPVVINNLSRARILDPDPLLRPSCAPAPSLRAWRRSIHNRRLRLREPLHDACCGAHARGSTTPGPYFIARHFSPLCAKQHPTTHGHALQ